MRRRSLAAGLLIVVFATSAFTCALGSSTTGKPCSSADVHNRCSRKSVQAKPACHSLKSVAEQCSLRGFAQFQAAQPRTFQVPEPPLDVRGPAARPRNSIIISSSIGSPETDRGPPRS